MVQIVEANGQRFEFDDAATDAQIGEALDSVFGGQATQQEGQPQQPAVDQRSAQDIALQQEKRIADLPELTGILSGESKAKAALLAPVLLTTTRPDEFAKIVTSNFPNIGAVQPGPNRDPVLFNNETGVAVQVNKEGFSPADLIQGLGIASAFFPTGAAATGTGKAALGKLAASAAATQSGIEASQAAAGGQVDPLDIAVAGVAAPVGQVIGEKVISPVARAAGGKISEAARNVIKAGEEKGVRVLTSDVAPPETFLGKSLQQLGEKLGGLGTGGIRARQQGARVEAVENLAQEFGVTIDSPLETSIVKNLEKGISRRLQKAGEIRNSAVQTLDTFGDVPVGTTVAAIDKQINKQLALRTEADRAIVDKLGSIKQSIVNGDFSLVKNLRSNLIDDINDAFKGEALPTKAAAPLQAVKSAMDKDLLTFARLNDRTAAAQWIQSNRLFADSLRKAKQTELSRLLKKGTDSPESVATILKGGKPSELNRLNRFVGEKGQESARAAIVRDALTESGFFTTGANPDRLATALNRPARAKAINVFFKGENKKQLDGLTRLLDGTRRAQQASLATPTGQTLIPLVAGAGAVADPFTTFLSAGSLAGATRAYESKAVRSLLLRLANTPKGSEAEKRILDKALPSVLSALQSVRPSLEEKTLLPPQIK